MTAPDARPPSDTGAKGWHRHDGGNVFRDGDREYQITVSAFGLDDAAMDALFDRVADAAHELNESVTCFGVLAPPCECNPRALHSASCPVVAAGTTQEGRT